MWGRRLRDRPSFHRLGLHHHLHWSTLLWRAVQPLCAWRAPPRCPTPCNLVQTGTPVFTGPLARDRELVSAPALQ